MKIALLFLFISFAIALPIRNVPTIANNTIADNNITITNNTSNILTRTLLTTINDYDLEEESDYLLGAEGSKLVGAEGSKLVEAEGSKLEAGVKEGNNLIKVDNKTFVINTTSHEHLTSNLQVYHNHTSHHLQNLETTIIAMLNKTRLLQKEEEESNKKNYENEKKILDKKRLEHKQYEQHLLSLHQQIVNLNKTILEFWRDIHTDTTYLQKLELLKPKFIGSVDKVNNEMDVLNKYIVDTIIEGDDKKVMLSMMFNIKNTTYYSSNDLAEAFLHHYEKYKNQLGKDTSSYHTEIEKLHELITNYKLYANKIHDDDYSKIVHLVRKLKHVYRLSKENTELLDELIYKIISILKNKSCSATSFTSSTKECSLELLKSHIANKLV